MSFDNIQVITKLNEIQMNILEKSLSLSIGLTLSRITLHDSASFIGVLLGTKNGLPGDSVKGFLFFFRIT